MNAASHAAGGHYAMARIGWGTVAALVGVLFALGVPAAAARIQNVCTNVVCEPWALTPGRVQALQATGMSTAQYATYVVLVEAAFALTYAAVAAFLVWRLATDHMAVFAAFTLLIFGGVGFGNVVATLEADPGLRAPAAFLGFAGGAGFVLFLFIFPDGRFVPRWTRWVALLWVLVQAPNTFIADGSSLREPYNGFKSLVFVAGILSAVFAQVYRYRRVSGAVQRQQTKWTVFGFALALSAYLGLGVLASTVPAISQDPLAGLAIYTGQYASMTLVPVSIGIAILRHRLYDIDLLINRTVAYAAVTGILAIGYLSVSAFSQRVVETVTGDRSGVLPNGAGLAVALGFQPLRRRVKAIVDGVLPPREELALLFTDIVGSTEKAATWGDARWREALERYRAAVRRELKRFGGHEVDTAGDGFFVSFTSPLPAVRCAQAVATATRGLGLPSRFGVHFGGCEVRGEKLTGINVHTAARVMSLAGADEVVVSEPVRMALSTDELQFVDRGTHALKGVPGEWRIYTVGF